MTLEAPTHIGQFGVLGQDVTSDDDIDLSGLLRAIWRGKILIVLTAMIGLAWGWYRANVVAVPMYTATSMVAMETRDENVLDISGVVTGLPGTRGTINTELGVMRSRGLIEKTVRALDLASDPEFNPGAAAEPATGPATGSATGPESAPQAAATGTPGVAPGLAPALPQRTLDAVVDRVMRRIRVSNEPDSYLFTISVTSQDPVKSARIATAHAEIYIEDQIEVKFRATEQATEWLSARLGTLQAELEAAEGAVEAFAAENRITRTGDLESLNLRIDDARERLAELTAREAGLADQIAALAAAAETGDYAAAAQAADDATFDRLLAQDAADAELAQRLDTLRTRLAGLRTRAATQIETLTASIEVLRQDYAEQSESLGAYQQLEREVSASRTIYEYFLGRLKELSAQQGNLRADSRIISEAAVPGAPSAPAKMRIITSGLIFGLMLGTGLVLLWELMHAGLRSAQELEAATGRPVLGQIPLVTIQDKSDVIRHFIDNPSSVAAESVRNLRTSILMSLIDRTPQVIMLTSSLPEEGKTTTAIALAHNITGLGKRVLLVEGDIRHRVFRDYLDLRKPAGLLTVLSGEKSLIEAVERDERIGADVLVGEQTTMNAADVFSSNRFRALITEARRIYDVIIIDTPPVLLVPDARVIGPLADAVVFAVEWNATAKRDVLSGLKMLQDGGLRITGLALTRIDLKKMKRYGQYGGYGAYASRRSFRRAYYAT